MPLDPAAWRPEFPILSTTTYMISNSLGAMPRGTAGKLAEYAQVWATRGVRAWEEGWWELPVTVGNAVAPLIGAAPGTVTMHQNVTLAQAVILSCFDTTGRRNRIVCEDANFPSVLYFYGAQRRLRLDPVPVEALTDAIDDQTLLVPISHVLFKTSFVQDVRTLVAKAHRVGAHVVLDCFQSAGVLPFSVAELGVDFAVGGCLKWLCGGPGNGYLYVRPDLARLRPSLTGWVAHERPFDFAPPPIRYSEGPMRFLNGTPHVPCLYAAMEGLRIVGEVGVAAIREHNLGLTERLYEGARARGFPTLTPADPARRGGTVCVDPAGAQEISRELLARGFLIDYRPGAGIRISPHFYNTAEECDAILAQIGALAAARGGSASRA